MIDKDQMIAIRHGFRDQYHGFAVKSVTLINPADMDIDPYASAVGCLVALVHEHVQSDADKAKHWLLAIVFPHSKTIVFLTVKDAYVHVMVALDAVIAMLTEAAKVQAA